MNRFWNNWLKVWCFCVLTFGLVLAAAAFPALDGPARWIYSLMDMAHAEPLSIEAPGLRFSIALVGAVTFGWGLTIVGMMRAARQGGAPVWRDLTAAFGLWYIVDSGISILTGFGLNAVSNTGFLIAYLIPVLRSGVLRG
jgi:hypothetical protein